MAFTKKEVDIEALMAQAAAMEAEDAASKSGKKKAKKDKKGKKEKKEKSQKKASRADSHKAKAVRTESKKEKKAKKKALKKGLEPKEVFGVHLYDLGIEEGDVPEIFSDLITVLEGHATETEGLFRKTAPVSEVSRLIDRYHAGEDIDWNDIEDKHLVGGVLMAFLLRLPEPIITFSAYDQLINVVATDDTEDEKLQKMRPIIQNLPALNVNMLEYLLDFLDTMTRDSDDNLMSSDNLAICFGPGLMHRAEENIGQLMKESGLVTAIITMLIDQYGYFFREEEIEELDGNSKKSQLRRDGTGSDFSAFITVAIKSLTESSKEIQNIAGELEWEKLWQPRALAHLLVMSDLFSTILQEDQMVDAAKVEEEINESLAYYLDDVSGKDLGISCKQIRSKFLKYRSTVEDVITAVGQQSEERDVVLNAITTSKSIATIITSLRPFIKKEQIVSSTDVSDVKNSVPGIKAQLNHLQGQLNICDNYHFAAVLSRVIRGVQKGLKERTKTPITAVDLSVPTTTPTAKDKLKIENLQDALEFSFPVCIKMLTKIVSELDDPALKSEAARSSDLLSEVSLVLQNFNALKLVASSTAKATPAPVAAHPTVAPHPRGVPPVAAHPKMSPKVAAHPRAAPEVAKHPKAAPKVAAHPKAAPKVAEHPKATAPPPVATHPRVAPKVAAHPKATAPPPVTTHPRVAPKVAAHPRAAPKIASHPKAAIPPPVACHPSSFNAAPKVAIPPPVSARPKTAVPPPLATHPKSSAPPPAAPHPASNRSAIPPPIGHHPKSRADSNPVAPNSRISKKIAIPSAFSNLDSNTRPTPKRPPPRAARPPPTRTAP